MIAILAHLIQPSPTDISALESSISALESSISALESSIATASNSLPFWEYVGFGGALLVVLGVLLELQDIRHRHAEDKTDWALSYFGLSRSLEKPAFWKKYRVELASVILVAGGVAIELGAGLMIESKNTALRAIDIELRSKNSALRSNSDQLLALVTQQAGDAARSAKTAHDEADAATAASKEAQGKIAKVSDRADGLTADVKGEQTELSQLRASVVSMSPRVLPIASGRPWVNTAIVNPLKPFAPRHAIIEHTPESEPKQAAEFIQAALSSAGWTVDSLRPIGGIDDGIAIEPYIAPPWDGLTATETEWNSRLEDQDKSFNAVNALVEFLHSYSWQASLEPFDRRDRELAIRSGVIPRDPWMDPEMTPDTVRIQVGRFPAVVILKESKSASSRPAKR